MKTVCQPVAHMNVKRIKKTYSLEKTVPLMINGISIRAEPDSGADVNVMDEYQFRAALHRSAEQMELKNSKIKLINKTEQRSYEGMINRTVRTKLDYISRIRDQPNKEKQISERDRLYKEKIKQNAENKNTKEHSFSVGDQVFVEQAKRNKWSAPYEQDIYIIYRTDGSTVSSRRKRDFKRLK